MLIRSYFLLFALVSCLALSAQEFVFPGDANNNGFVDHYDALQIGYAFGSIGPIRNVENHSEPQEIILHWSNDFPGGLNYIHADANGNGLVELLDFALLAQNQGLTFEEVTEPIFSTGIWGLDPSISFNGGDDVVVNTDMSVLSIPIDLNFWGTTDLLNGIAFKISIETDFVSEVSFSFSDEGLNTGGQAFQFQRRHGKEIWVSITRFGIDPVPGGGLIGTLNAILIEDLINLLPPKSETNLCLAELIDIQAVDDVFNLVPMAANCLEIYGEEPDSTVVNTDEATSNGLSAIIYPNPSNDLIQLESGQAFSRVELITSKGETNVLYDGAPIMSWEDDLKKWPSGLYYLRIIGVQSQSLLPLMKLD